MATHEVYVGGPASANYSRSMYPTVPFNKDGDAFQRVKVSAHKGPTGYGLTRVLDPTQDTALAEFARMNTIAQADKLGAILIPKNVILKGFFYEVERVAGAPLVITPSLRGVGGATLPVIDCNVLSKGYASFGGASWSKVTEPVAAGSPAIWFVADPSIIDLTLTTMDAANKLGAVRLVLTPMVDTLYHGQY